jgi:acyl-CoA thioesterase-2
MSRTAPTAMQQLSASLDIEPLEQDLFRGTSPQVGWQRVFGGQVIGQALVAAQRTISRQAGAFAACLFHASG